MTPVDIMLVTFNHPEAVKAVVALLYRHTASPFRLLIADNGRDPQMLDFLHRVAKKKDNVLLVENSENKFCCVATNQLLSLCESPYIFYLCSYETFVVKPAWDLACIQAMEAHPLAGMGGYLSWSKHYATGADYSKHDFFPKFRNSEYVVSIMEKKCFHIQGGFFILRKTMYDHIGGFNETLQHAYMDVEYSYYAESIGWRLLSLPTVLSIHRSTRPNLDGFNLRNFEVIHPLTIDQCQRELPEVALSLPWEETLITNDRLENGGAIPVHAEESSPNDMSSTVLERDVTRQTAPFLSLGEEIQYLSKHHAEKSQQTMLNAKRDNMQDNADYWRERHKQRYGALSSVGDIRKSEEENLELYAYKKRRIAEALHELHLLDLRGKSVLDVGCGIGLLSEVFWILGAKVCGLDASPEALSFARRRAPNSDFKREFVSDFDFERKFDLVVCADVLYHIIDEAAWKKALALLKQHLLPNGYLIIIEQLKEQEVCAASHVRFRTHAHYLNEATVLQLRRLEFTSLHPTVLVFQHDKNEQTVQ